MFPSRPMVCALALLGALAFLSAPAVAARPNILFIYTDDQGPWAVGAEGAAQVKTPNIDRLFKEGARLTHAFVGTPVCSPARVNVLASRYGAEVGITDWINPRSEKKLGLDPKVATWPKLLAGAGYATGLVGKWHLGTADRFHPTRMGYRYFMGFREGGTRVKGATLEVDGKPRKFEGYTVNILTDYAIAFLRKNRRGPFALSVHYRSPHAPWLPLPTEDWSAFEKMESRLPEPDHPHLRVDHLKRVWREYLGSVASVDRNVGRLLAVLEQLGLDDNTVVIFTSDHGYNISHHALLYKGNAQWMLQKSALPPATKYVPNFQRPNLFDTSIRVPAGIRWPGVIAPGTVVDDVVLNLDWFPTLLAIAGVELPEGVTIRGHNVLPLLKGEKDTGRSNEFYAEYSMHHGATTHMRMWRTPKWKLIRDFRDRGRDELYNLEKDPGETNNLIHDPSDEVRRVIEKLHAKIIARMREIGDPALEFVSKQETRQPQP